MIPEYQEGDLFATVTFKNSEAMVADEFREKISRTISDVAQESTLEITLRLHDANGVIIGPG